MITDEYFKKTADQKSQFLKEILSKEKCEVTFIKINGETRVMPCTLKADLLPKVDLNENKANKSANHEVLSVWCIDQNSWRSFRVDNVTGLKVIS